MTVAHPPSSLGLSAIDIAEGVRTGVLSPVDVVRDHLDHIAAADPRIGAFRHVRAEAALREAQAVAASPARATLPLAGVPVAVKDNIPVAGESMRVGSQASSSRPSGEDHELVRRLRAAGAIVVGLTRMPELGIWPFSDEQSGTARNPWNTERTAGGSSGGSAAAVAAGMVPLAHGNDGLGSVRIPAAACGLVGLKPGDGVVPSAIGKGSWFGMAVNGVLASSVADAALMASVLAANPLLARSPPPRPLRIALSTRSPVPRTRTEAGVEAAVRGVAELLRTLGHQVEEVRLDVPASTMLAVLAHWFAGTAADAELLEDPSRMLPRSRGHARLGRIAQALGLVRPGARERWQARFLDRISGYDLVLTPTTATTAVAAEGWAARGWLANFDAAARFAPFTGATNFAGLPAITLPAGLHANGLPIGAQFIGRPGAEGLLLGLALQVERARPWRRHAPGWRAAGTPPDVSPANRKTA